MGNLSNYRSTGVPIGATVMFHKAVTPSLITDKGSEYLRTGEFVPYQTKYATAASRGLKLDGSGAVFNPGQLTTNFASAITVASWLTYAKGALHMMHQTVSDTLAGSGEEVTFLITKVSGDTLGSPGIVVTPTLQSLGIPRYSGTVNYRSVSQPFYVTGCNQWACVIVSDNASTGAGNARLTMYVATSVDGVTWRLSGTLGGMTDIAQNTINGFRITAASIGNQVNYALAMQIGTSYSINVGSGNLDSQGNVAAITRTPTVYRNGVTDTYYTTSGNLFAAPISPKGMYFYHADTGSTSVLRILDDSVLDIASVPVGTANLSANLSSYAGTRALITSNGTAAFIYLFDSAKDDNAITIPDIADLKTFTLHSFPSSTDTGAASYAYPNTSGFLFALPISGTATQCYRITPAGVVTSLTNALTDTVNSNALQTANHTFDNHIYLQMNAADKVVNISNNSNTDFTPAAGTISLGTYLTDAISADGTNILLAYGGATNSAAGSIAKSSTSNFNARSLKYIDTVTNGPCHSYGIFKRLTDVSQTLVFISKNTNLFLSSTDNGETWISRTVTGVGVVRDIDFIGTNYVVVGDTTGTTNFAYGTVMGTWTNGVIGSTAVNCRNLFNTGTSLIVVNSNTGAYRSTTGASWAVQAGTTITTAHGASYAKNGTTHHIYTPSATAGKVIRQQSTDDGVTWSTVSTVPSLALNATGQVPGKFVFSNNKWYCLPVNTNTNQSDLEIYETSDLITFSKLPTVVNTMAAPGYYASLVLNNGTIYALASAGTQNLSNYGFGMLVYKINGATPSFIGTLEQVASGGQIGYVRIK